MNEEQQSGKPKSRKALEDLQKEAANSQKYVRIRQLIESKDYTAARQRLYDDFLNKGNHAYRDVANLYAQMVHAEQQQGQKLFRRRYAAFLNTNVIVIIVLISLTSFILGLVSSSFVNLRELSSISPIIPLGIIIVLWVGAFVLFFLNQRRKI